MPLCEYNCNQEATTQLKNGKWCCSNHWNKCPGLRKKNAEGVSKAHKEGKCTSEHLTNEKRIDWSKGKTILDDPRVARKIKKDKIFIEHSVVGTGYVKKLMMLAPEYEHKCKICGNTEWLGKPIALELDHVNGDHYDNRKDNLRFICPNCHALTDTWKGRNKKGVNQKVTDEELIDALKTCPNIRQALLKVGLSGMGKNYTRAYELKSQIDKDQSKDILTNVENNIVENSEVTANNAVDKK